jgi:hypothetical protein
LVLFFYYLLLLFIGFYFIYLLIYLFIYLFIDSHLFSVILFYLLIHLFIYFLNRHHTHNFIHELNQTTNVYFEDGYIQKYWAVNNQLQIRVHTNPENQILHTELVRRNGFIFGQTAG